MERTKQFVARHIKTAIIDLEIAVVDLVIKRPPNSIAWRCETIIPQSPYALSPRILRRTLGEKSGAQDASAAPNGSSPCQRTSRAQPDACLTPTRARQPCCDDAAHDTCTAHLNAATGVSNRNRNSPKRESRKRTSQTKQAPAKTWCWAYNHSPTVSKTAPQTRTRLSRQRPASRICYPALVN
jgi:hypothetical protein